MDQLPLDIIPRLAYAPEGFVMHEGAAGVYQRCLSHLTSSGFSICCIWGPEQSGKTHFSVKLAADLAARACKPLLVDAPEFSGLAAERQLQGGFDSKDVVILDGADRYFTAGRGSGEFVSVVEALRVARGKIALFSAVPFQELPVDDHVFSRLKPGEGFVIENPAEKDVPGLIEVMARQRGLHLSPRRIDFLSRRLARDIAAIAGCLDYIVRPRSLKASDYAFLNDAAFRRQWDEEEEGL